MSSFSPQEIEEFKTEALELLDLAEKALLALDAGADFKKSFDTVFRSLHNVKGASGMMELSHLQAHTHSLENILMEFKNAASLPPTYVSLFLRGIDAARSILDGREVKFSFETDSAQALVPPTTPTPPSESTFIDDALNEFLSEGEEILERLSVGLQLMEAGKTSKDSVDAIYRDTHSLKGAAYLFSYNQIGNIAHAMESSLEQVRAGTHHPSKQLINNLFETLKLAERLFERIKNKTPFSDIDEEIPPAIESLTFSAAKLEPTKTTSENTTTVDKESEGPSSIRVPVTVLDNLMTMMGEMVLVRNQVLQYSNQSDDPELLSMSKRLSLVTSEIQEEMMKTRMQPIGNLIGKFNRVVRDLAKDLQKKIQLNLSGAETEIDKSLLEAVKDPLTHIVRNACDHGIESPAARRNAGKAEVGSIHIKAYHEGGQVIVEVSDDGKGLSKELLVNKAIEKGLVSPAQANLLSEKEAMSLIFHPGFSTAAEVTNISGRGVGMDVVRTNIEKIGGIIDLTSQPGAGTCIKLKIPLTLAIIPALVVKCGDGTFAIPQVKLEELVRVDQSSSDSKIELLHGAPVYRLRGNIMPIIDLCELLNIKRDRPLDYSTSTFNLAVLNAESCLFGVIIDEVKDTADIVVKPLNRLLKSLQVYSGATILGDGSIALILDVMGIAKLIQLKQPVEEQKRHAESMEKVSIDSDIQDFLLVQLNSPAKHAIVLNYVHRMEEFKLRDIEFSGDQPMIRYRDVLLPLIFANELLGYGQSDKKMEIWPVVVIQRAGELYGLVMDNIIDTYSTSAELSTSFTKDSCVLGNLNTKDELIVVLNPAEMISKAFPLPPSASLSRAIGEGPAGPGAFANLSGKRILIVEDLVFFRKTLKSILEKAGVSVITACDGLDAINLLNQKQNAVDLIISDIDMPKINGFEFVSTIRKNSAFSHIPVMAISSRIDKEYVDTGMLAGFDLYLEKMKPEEVLRSVATLLQKQRSAA